MTPDADAAASANGGVADEDHVRRVLRERAAALASPQEQKAPSDVLRLMTFAVAGQCYGVEVDYLRQVVRRPEVTPVGGAPTGLVGVVNLRGELLSVADLARLTGAGRADDAARMLVLDHAGLALGLLADDVHDLVAVPAESIAPPSVDPDAAANLVLGVTPDLIIVDGDRLLTDSRLYLDQTRST